MASVSATNPFLRMFKGGAASTSDGLLASISACATKDEIVGADRLQSSIRSECFVSELVISTQYGKGGGYQFLCSVIPSETM